MRARAVGRSWTAGRTTCGRSRIKDLPMGHRPLEVIWRKRRYRCAERGCPQRVFTERSDQVPPRHRLTARLRARLESAASRCARALSDVAAEYGVSWWSVHRALVLATVDRATEAPPPVRMLGLDETRARSVRWTWEDGTGWRSSSPWMTSFVDLDTGRPGWLLGLVAGRSGAAIESWLAAQPQSWRDGVEVGARDPPGTAAGQARRRPLAPGAAGQSGAHRGASAGRPAAARAPRPPGRPGLGAPAAAARRREPALPARPRPTQARARGRRPDERDRCRLGRQGAAAPAARRPDGPRRAAAIVPLLRRRARRGHGRDHPARRDRAGLVARHRGVPAAARDQCPHRGDEPSDQAVQAGRLWLPQSRQLRAPYRPARRRQERGATSVSGEFHHPPRRATEEPLDNGLPAPRRPDVWQATPPYFHPGTGRPSGP